MLNNITPIISTYNEAPNIERVLNRLSWAKEVLVIDSFSTDQTLEICAQFNNVRVIQNAYTGPTDQSNFGLKQDIKTDWVMSMDADYVLTSELENELAELTPDATIKAFEISFEYLIDGQVLRGSLYPPRTALYQHKFANYQRDGHTQRVKINGLVSQLTHKFQHDDRKPYDRWLASQRKYANQEAQKLNQSKWHTLSWPDRLRYLGVAPLAIIPYTLIVKGLALNGVSGFKYAWQRLIAEIYLQKARLGLKL